MRDRHGELLGMKERYQRLKDAGICVSCKTQKATPGMVHCERCRLKLRDANQRRQYSSNYHGAARKDAISAYGGKCVSCGIDDPDVLDFDHIHNDGHLDRVNWGGTSTVRFLRHLAEHKPDNIQLVCANCHRKRHALERRSESHTPS